MELKQNEVLEDLFGDKKIIQNTTLYRFTSDSVMLSRFVKGKKGDRVADFCAGSGIVGFHFYYLNPHISTLDLFELQPTLADMARRTAEYNQTPCTVHCQKLQEIGNEYNDAFSLILCNPPYEKSGLENVPYEKAVCRKELELTLKEIVQISAKKLKFGGRLVMVHRADRLAELIYLCKSHGLEPKKMQLLCGNEGDKPYLVLLAATKGGKEGIEVLPTAVNDGRTGDTASSS